MSQATSPTIEVTHVTSLDDFKAFVAVEDAAFGPSPLQALMFPTPASDAVKVQRHQESWSTDPTTRYQKACLPSGQIVGIAKWNFYLTDVDEDKISVPLEGLPPGTNEPLFRCFLGGMDKARNEAMKGKKHFLMSILAVDPNYQRIGVGVKLLEWGLAEADREGVECWINSSPYGLGLYKKHGWEEVGGMDIDLAEYGGEKGAAARPVFLVRQPRKKAI